MARVFVQEINYNNYIMSCYLPTNPQQLQNNVHNNIQPLKIINNTHYYLSMQLIIEYCNKVNEHTGPKYV